MNTQHLLADETVIYEGKLHKQIFVVPGLFAVFAFVAMIGLLMVHHPIPAVVLVLVALMAALPAFLRYRTNGLVLTNKRVISNRGVTSRRSIDIALSKIEGASVDQTVVGQVLNYGTIMIRGTGGGLEQFPLLAAPAEFSKALHQQIGS